MQVERGPRPAGPHMCLTPDGGRQHGRFDQRTICKDDSALHCVLKLPDVSGPGVVFHEAEGFRAEAFNRFAILGGELIEELAGKQQEVAAAGTQRRQINGDDVETEVEIFPEEALIDKIAQICVGGGDDAEVDRDERGSTDAANLAFLKGTEEADLGLRRKVGYFVEKQRSAVGAFEVTDAAGGGSREGSFFVPEEFAFDEVFRDGAAVEGDEGFRSTGPVVVDGAGSEFLAGAGFAQDHDGGGGGGDGIEEVEHLAHGRRGSGDVREAAAVGGLAAQAHYFDLEAVFLIGPPGDGGEHLEVTQAGFLDEVVGRAGPHGGDGELLVAHAGDENKGQVGPIAADLLKKFDASESGQVVVREDDVEFGARQQVQRMLGGGGVGGLDALGFQFKPGKFGVLGVVFNDQNMHPRGRSVWCTLTKSNWFEPT